MEKIRENSYLFRHREAIGMIQDHSTLCTIGMTLVSASETVLKAIEQKFLDTGTPRGLTLFHLRTV